MSARTGKVRHPAGARKRGTVTGTSPRALYARPMALRQLYADAGSMARGSQWDAVVAHRRNSR